MVQIQLLQLNVKLEFGSQKVLVNGQDVQMNGTMNKLIHKNMMFILILICGILK